jgi:hypothetical protein
MKSGLLASLAFLTVASLFVCRLSLSASSPVDSPAAEAAARKADADWAAAASTPTPAHPHRHITLPPMATQDFDELFAAGSDPLVWAQHPGPGGGTRAGSPTTTTVESPIIGQASSKD